MGGAKEDGDVGMQWEGGLRDEKDSWHSADEGESQETLGENAEETVTNVDDVDMGGDGTGRSEPWVGAERGGDGPTTPAAATTVGAGLRLKMNPVPIAFKCLSCRSGGQVNSLYLSLPALAHMNGGWRGCGRRWHYPQQYA